MRGTLLGGSPERGVEAVTGDPSASGDRFDRWSSKAEGERARRAISLDDGRSGMELRTSVSMRCRTSVTDRQAAPTWRATWGSRSGPSKITATAAMTRSFAGSRLSTLSIRLTSTVWMRVARSIHGLGGSWSSVWRRRSEYTEIRQKERYVVAETFGVVPGHAAR